MTKYNSGKMPRSIMDIGYEELEGTLGSFYLSILPLKNSRNEEDCRDFDGLNSRLRELSRIYNVQMPEDAAKNPRTNIERFRPKPVTSARYILNLMGDLIGDFAVGCDSWETYHIIRYLSSTVVGVFDRQGIAKAEKKTVNGDIVLEIKKGSLNESKRLEEIMVN